MIFVLLQSKQIWHLFPDFVFYGDQSLFNFYLLSLTVLRADLNGPNFSYPRVLRAVHIGPNFDVKNKLSALIYS